MTQRESQHFFTELKNRQAPPDRVSSPVRQEVIAFTVRPTGSDASFTEICMPPQFLMDFRHGANFAGEALATTTAVVHINEF